MTSMMASNQTTRTVLKRATNLSISSFAKLLSKGIWKVAFIYFILVCFSLCKYSSMLCILRLLSKSVWIHSIIFLLLNHHYINWYHINQGLCYGPIDKVVILQQQLDLIKYLARYWLPTTNATTFHVILTMRLFIQFMFMIFLNMNKYPYM